jgi:hypothetical protein
MKNELIVIILKRRGPTKFDRNSITSLTYGYIREGRLDYGSSKSE